LTLIDFYQNLIVDAFHKFEPVWRLDREYKHGIRWIKRNYPNQEQLQLTDLRDETPLITYSILLPESYLQTTIFEEIGNYRSQYKLTLFVLDRKVWLSATLSTSNLQESIMGFIHQARSQLMNIVDSTIQLQNDYVMAGWDKVNSH